MANNGNDAIDERRTGPFRKPFAREQPWEAAEIERGPFERRTAQDRRAPSLEEDESVSTPEDRRRRWGRRKSDVLSTDARGSLAERGRALAVRFREPLIGLTLAGVAAPLVNAGINPETTKKASAKAAGTAESAEAAADRNLEEEVGDYWADSEEDVLRAHTVEGAVTRWGITDDLAEKIYDYAVKHDIEPDIAYGLVFTESTFQERAVSHVGARGLTQVMPRTAQWLDPTVSSADLFDPDVNLDLGFSYLRQMIDKYDGNVENALTAYNRGPGTVDRILNRGGNPDNGYAGKVLAG